MVTVMFTCKVCGLDRQPVQVPARETTDVPVQDWVRRVGEIVGEEHRRLCPCCPSGTCDLYLPAPDEAEFIGQQVE